MTAFVSSRFKLIEESATFAVADTVKRLRAAGETIHDLGGGDPDFPTPAAIVESAHTAMQEGFTHYVGSRGIPSLLEAIAEKLSVDNGLQCPASSGIIVTPSAKHALYIALLTVLDIGDEVIIPTPSWVTYEAIIHLVGATPVMAELDADENFAITAEALAPHITSRTKAILINTPNNPTGRVLTAREADVIADLADRHDLVIIADEIYEKIIYDGRTHLSVGARPELADRTLTVNGFSKAYAMTGWRLGYLAGPPPIIAEALKAQQHTVGCAASFAQRGGVTALRGPRSVVEEMRLAYLRRRDLIVDGLQSVPGIRCSVPEGAFYAFADIRGTQIPDSAEFAQFLLTQAKVAVTPGAAFGPGGEGHVRLSFANSDKVITDAVHAMAAALR